MADAPIPDMAALLELRSTTLLDLDDAGHVLVGNDDTGSSQLYEIDVDGRWRQLTDLGEPATGRYLPGPGSRRLVISADDAGTERTQLWLLDLDDPHATPQPIAHDPAYIHTLSDVGDDTVVYATNRRDGVEFDIVARTVSTGDERVLYDQGGWFESIALSPDGKLLAASRLTLVPASTQLLVVDTTSGQVTPVTDDTEPGDWVGICWTPDGDALLASSDSGAERFSVRRYDVADGRWEVVLADDAADLLAVPSPDGSRCAVVRTVDGADELFVCDVTTTGRSLELLDAAHRIDLPGNGVVSYRANSRWSPAGTRFGFSLTTPTQPPEAYSWTAQEGVTRRTESNRDRPMPTLPDLTSHLIPSFDGEQVPVFVMRGDTPDGSAVMLVHGGPEAATVRSFNPVATAFALAGHTVLLPNVRGSAGYGRRWVSLDDVEKRLDSVSDLVAIRDWAPEVGVDPDRIALYGGSYGGYMVLAGLTFHPQCWAAGVDIVGMSSLTTFLENTSAYRRAYREREYGSLAEHRDVLDAASPLPRISHLVAPLFIVHGANDPRVPLSEAEQVAAAVRANGAACELAVYPDEGHGLAKRANRLDAYPRAAAFLATHLASTSD
jgi:dipeptidyl aminopeptidase/acylaminoacyl peptidase